MSFLAITIYHVKLPSNHLSHRLPHKKWQENVGAGALRGVVCLYDGHHQKQKLLSVPYQRHGGTYPYTKRFAPVSRVG